MIANNNLINMTGGSKIMASYRDFVYPPKEETRTSEEIISNIRAKIRSIK